MDATIRQLQRSNPDAAILAKLRAGQYREWQIEALAALGNPLFGGSQVPEWADWDVRRDLLQKLPLRLTQEFAILCAEKALPAWEADYPQDKRPKAAILAAKAHLRGEISAEECRDAADAAWAAGAAYAAYAAAYAAYAAYAAAAAYAADSAVYAYYAADSAAASAAFWAADAANATGWDWQIPALTSLILAWEECP